VRHGTTHAFKGMESPAVVVTDVRDLADAEERELFYVATSRAQDRLAVLAHKNVSEDLMQIISEQH